MAKAKKKTKRIEAIARIGVEIHRRGGRGAPAAEFFVDVPIGGSTADMVATAIERIFYLTQRARAAGMNLPLLRMTTPAAVMRRTQRAAGNRIRREISRAKTTKAKK